MHRVTVTESYARDRTGEAKLSPFEEPAINGLIAHILPPVDLTQEAVSQFVGHGTFAEVYDDGPPQDIGDPMRIGNPILVGSSNKKTTIVLGSEGLDADYDGLAPIFGERVVDLLGYLGIEAELFQANDRIEYRSKTLQDGII